MELLMADQAKLLIGYSDNCDRKQPDRVIHTIDLSEKSFPFKFIIWNCFYYLFTTGRKHHGSCKLWKPEFILRLTVLEG